MKELASRNIQSVLIEGGAQLHASFVELGLWDEARIITAPLNLGSGVKAPVISGDELKTELAGDDSISYLRNTNS